MTKFITLHMLLEQSGGKSKNYNSPRMVEAPPFLNWKIGYRVKPRSQDETFTIHEIEDADKMAYAATVTLKNVAGEERKIKGSTLQSGYAFVDHGDVRAPEVQGSGDFGVPTKGLTVQVSCIRDFYPRKNEMPGTRVILTSGTAYAVADSYARIAAAVEATEV